MGFCKKQELEMAPKHKKQDGGGWSTEVGNSIASEQVLGGEENELGIRHVESEDTHGYLGRNTENIERALGKRQRFESLWPVESPIHSFNKYCLTALSQALNTVVNETNVILVFTNIRVKTGNGYRESRGSK